MAVAVDDVAAEHALRDRTEEVHEVFWDGYRREVRAVRRRRIGAIALDGRPWRDPPADRVRVALAEGVAASGPAAVFDRWAETEELHARLALARPRPANAASRPSPTGPDEAPRDGPPEAIDALLDRVASSGRTSRSDLASVDVAGWLRDGLSWEDRRAIDELAPPHLELTSGRRVRVRYGPDGPVVSTRLQDLLGTDVHPTVGVDRVPVVLELLSPAGRPLQRTSDLPRFWRGSYAAVRAEMRGRYPKHRWPERPWEPPPTPTS